VTTAKRLLKEDFEVFSNYDYVDPSVAPGTPWEQWPLWRERNYTIAGNPSAVHPLFASFGDHTSGAGKMFIANGVQDTIVWSRTVSGLTAGQSYIVRAWAATAYPLNAAILRWSAVGVATGAQVTLPLSTGQWVLVSLTFTAPGQQVTIELRDLLQVAGGNDFVVDDIEVVSSGSGGPSFTLSLSPTGHEVARGEGAAFTVMPVASGGFSAPVTLSASSLPPGTTATFSPSVVTPGQTSTVSLQTSGGTPSGGQGFMVSGSGQGTSSSAAGSLTIASKSPGALQVLSTRTVHTAVNPPPGATCACQNPPPPGCYCRNIWEPSAASGTTWAAGWTELVDLGGPSGVQPPSVSRLKAWTGNGWGYEKTLPQPPGDYFTADIYLGWDSVRQRFVVVWLEAVGSFIGSTSKISYGYSKPTANLPAAAGADWEFSTSPVFDGQFWDYPSIAVDAGGRVAVGAADSTGRFWVAVSNNGGADGFPTRSVVPTSLSDLPEGTTEVWRGYQSRVVAAGTTFHAFIPTLEKVPQTSLPRRVERWESASGSTWVGPQVLLDFEAPLNHSPNTYSASQPSPAKFIFYSPKLDAKGSPNGYWVVAFPVPVQVGTVVYNNIVMCASSRSACWYVNPAESDEFLGTVSLGTSNGQPDYWVSYLTYSTLQTRSLPLISQVIYYAPADLTGIWANVNTAIFPYKWIIHPDRCPSGCFAAGDYLGFAANPFAGATTTFVNDSGLRTGLYQTFVQDPPGQAIRPQPVHFPIGSNLRIPGFVNTQRAMSANERIGPFRKRRSPMEP
jgi:hypothetical protein